MERHALTVAVTYPAYPATSFYAVLLPCPDLVVVRADRAGDARLGSFRFLASYLILGSTFGLVASFVLSTGALLVVPRSLAIIRYEGSLGGTVVVVGYMVGLVAGGVVGIVGGAVTAYRLNRRVGLDRRH